MKRLFAKICFTLPEEQHDRLISWFSSPALLGAEQTEETLILWFDKQLLPGNSLDNFMAERLQLFGQATIDYTIDVAHSMDWYENWQRTLKPIRIGKRALIVPFDKYEDCQSGLDTSTTDLLVIVIEPKMSFGTGHHETTQMCAELLMDSVKPGELWLDLGTGSGILAIIAAKCGAERVIAYDNDSVAIEEAKLNAQRNDCDQKIEFCIADVLSNDLPMCNGVVANLFSPILEQISLSLARSLRVGGYAILSGILIEQEPSLLRAYEEKGFVLNRRIKQGEWVALQLQLAT